MELAMLDFIPYVEIKTVRSNYRMYIIILNSTIALKSAVVIE